MFNLIKDISRRDYDEKKLQKNDINFLVGTNLLDAFHHSEKRYEDRLKITDAWYNKRWFGIVCGVVGTSTAIYLAGQL